MGDKYHTEYKSGNFLELDITPTTDYVVDNATGERVGEVVHWQYQEVGELIEEGKWDPYTDEDKE